MVDDPDAQRGDPSLLASSAVNPRVGPPRKSLCLAFARLEKRAALADASIPRPRRHSHIPLLTIISCTHRMGMGRQADACGVRGLSGEGCRFLRRSEPRIEDPVERMPEHGEREPGSVDAAVGRSHSVRGVERLRPPKFPYEGGGGTHRHRLIVPCQGILGRVRNCSEILSTENARPLRMPQRDAGRRKQSVTRFYGHLQYSLVKTSTDSRHYERTPDKPDT